MRCISIINQKGGCGKTTVATNLAASLAYQGRRTLLVDMDPQSHCAVGLAVPEEQIERNIYDVLISAYNDNTSSMKDITWQISQNFDLAPSGIELAALDPQLADKEHREDQLRNVLEEVQDLYEYVVIDCPPSVGILTFNALRAADEVIIPVETGYFALHGLARQLDTLAVLEQQCRQNIKIKIVASMYDVRTKLAREVLSELRKNYTSHLLQTVINFNTKLKEASSFGQAITEYDPSSKGMRDFLALAQELIAQESLAEPHATGVKNVHQQLREISRTANELLEESAQLIGTNPTSPEMEKATLQEKIDNFYGVRQQQDKVIFAALYPKAELVQIAGDFNNWQPENTPLQKIGENGVWQIKLPMNKGKYRYRLVVDGQWQQDPYNELTELNPYGEYNSVLEVH